MGLTLLDTGVVIGFLDADDPFHSASHEAIAELVDEGEFFCIAAVSYAELLTGVGLGHHDRRVVDGFLNDFSVRVLPVDQDVARAAAQIRSTHTERRRGQRRRPGVKMPDALILGTAQVTDRVDRLLVADRQWPTVDVGVEVRLLGSGSQRRP